MLFVSSQFLIALAILLTTTFVSVGILSCWAATSPRHWFLRTAVVFALLSPLLFAHALEPFAILLLHAATVAFGITVWRVTQFRSFGDSTDEKSSKSAKDSFRFSLTTILLAIGVTAAVLAVLIQMPELNGNAWGTMVLVGVCSGLCVVLAHLGTQARIRLLFSIPALLITSMLVAIPLFLFDWLVQLLAGESSWPPVEEGLASLGFWGTDQSTWLWFVICPSVSIFIAILLSLYRVGFARRDEESSQSIAIPLTVRRVASLFTSILFVSILLVPVYGMWVLLRPPEFIQTQTSDCDNYKKIVGLSQAIERSKFSAIISNWDIETKVNLTSAIADVEQDMARLSVAIRQPTQVPLDYHWDDLSVDEWQSIRTVARALSVKGRLAMLNDQPNDACDSYLDGVRFGFAVRDRGLLIDGVVGIACTSSGMTMLYDHRESYSSRQCQIAARELLSMSDRSESYEQIRTRDRGWMQLAYGWYGRIQQSLEDMVDGDLQGIFGNTLHVFAKEQAEMRLLATELSLRAYHLDHAHWPDSLSQLVPEYLPTVPADPFDSSLGVLRYARSSDQYSLYSIGPDGIDDGGQRPTNQIEIFDHGDLLLDASYSDDNADL